MALTMKYGPVLEICNKYNMKEAKVEEAAGSLKISGTVHTQYEKNSIWDKIKEIGGQTPTDLKADIKVEANDYYHIHKVVSGDSLSKIAKVYFEDANKYMKIFEVNKDQLKNPDLIKVGQELKIPFDK